MSLLSKDTTNILCFYWVKPNITKTTHSVVL